MAWVVCGEEMAVPEQPDTREIQALMHQIVPRDVMAYLESPAEMDSPDFLETKDSQLGSHL